MRHNTGLSQIVPPEKNVRELNKKKSPETKIANIARKISGCLERMVRICSTGVYRTVSIAHIWGRTEPGAVSIYRYRLTVSMGSPC